MAKSCSSAEPTPKTIKCKCGIRWFYSKGAILVLVWTILLTITTTYHVDFINMYTTLDTRNTVGFIGTILKSLPIAAFVVCVPLCGWLADTRFGSYKLCKTGSVIMCFVAIMICMWKLVVNNTNVSQIATLVVATVIFSLEVFGILCCSVTLLQLGLQQMPDASSENVTSYISWFIFSMFVGLWVSGASYHLFPYCFDFWSSSDNACSSFKQIISLFPVLCMTVVLCSDFLLSPKWLIVEPKSPQFLKLILQVLKFAAKHKAPVNRSAFTYWEDDIPSRIDLGKSKYGGPFTTEQVEDVKTFFKILAVSVPFVIVLLGVSVLESHHTPDTFSSQSSIILYYFTYKEYLSVIVGTMVYEFIIYPCVKSKLPSILRRFGAASFMNIVLSIVSLVLSVLGHYNNNIDSTVWSGILVPQLKGLMLMSLSSSALEFVCAQSPYNMRTLVFSYISLLLFSPFTIGSAVHSMFNNYCTNPYCLIIRNSIALSLALIGFLFHCILARWYKRRVRDDIYSVHRVVEEVYDRYLSAKT